MCEKCFCFTIILALKLDCQCIFSYLKWLANFRPTSTNITAVLRNQQSSYRSFAKSFRYQRDIFDTFYFVNV